MVLVFFVGKDSICLLFVFDIFIYLFVNIIVGIFITFKWEWRKYEGWCIPLIYFKNIYLGIISYGLYTTIIHFWNGEIVVEDQTDWNDHFETD